MGPVKRVHHRSKRWPHHKGCLRKRPLGGPRQEVQNTQEEVLDRRSKDSRGGPGQEVQRLKRRSGHSDPQKGGPTVKISKRGTLTVPIKGCREVLTVRSPKGRSDSQDLKPREVRGDKDTRGKAEAVRSRSDGAKQRGRSDRANGSMRPGRLT